MERRVGFGFHFMAFNDFGDKFFPAASFSPNGRLTVSYSSREDDASFGEPQRQAVQRAPDGGQQPDQPAG